MNLITSIKDKKIKIDMYRRKDRQEVDIVMLYKIIYKLSQNERYKSDDWFL